MKTGLKILLGIVIFIILAIIFVLAYFGYVPGLSSLLGADKPRDLGITYTEADHTSARAKSQVVYEELPANTPVESSIVRSGSRPITASWTSSEMTSLMNNRPWKYWPIKNVQLKINNDGTAELSGVVVREKLKSYAVAIGVPKNVADIGISLLPSSAVFYVKAKTSLTGNKVSDFDIQSVSLGKMPIPTGILLSSVKIINHTYAETLTGELSKYSGKRAAIVNFINSRLSQITGFFAKRAYFSDGKLNFDGTLSEKEATVR